MAVWLPEEFVVFYLLRGEVVNATIMQGGGARAVGIATALDRIPSEPEYGEICFHEADEQQLACMFASQSLPDEPWSPGMQVTDPAVLFPYLNAMAFDGFMEIVAEDTVNYLVFNNGAVQRAFLSTTHHGTPADRVAKLFAREGRAEGTKVRRWPGPETLPTQAPPALVLAYRELAAGMVGRLTADGRESAATLAESARQHLLAQHPVLDGFAFDGRDAHDVIVDSETLTSAVGAWVKEFLFASHRSRNGVARNGAPRRHVGAAPHVPIGRPVRAGAVESRVTAPDGEGGVARGRAGTRARAAVRGEHPHRQHGGLFVSGGGDAPGRGGGAGRGHPPLAPSARPVRHRHADAALPRAQ